MSPLVDENLAARIRRTPDPELTGEWPGERLASLREAGVFRWGLPVEFGGRVVTSPQLLEGYLELARLCLTTAFILTQRDAACHRIANSPNLELRQRVLPDHCSGRALATVGISHLSTSRQHWSRPSVVARRTAGGQIPLPHQPAEGYRGLWRDLDAARFRPGGDRPAHGRHP